MSVTTPASTRAAQTVLSPWRSAGLWMSALLVAYLFFNAIRTLFLSLFGLALFLRRSYASLALFLLVAAVMPIGDAPLV